MTVVAVVKLGQLKWGGGKAICTLLSSWDRTISSIIGPRKRFLTKG